MPKQLLIKKKSPLVSHAYDSDVESVTLYSTVNFHHEAHDISSVADPSSNNEFSNARFQTEPADKRSALTVNPQVDKDPANEIESAVERNNSK